MGNSDNKRVLRKPALVEPAPASVIPLSVRHEAPLVDDGRLHPKGFNPDAEPALPRFETALEEIGRDINRRLVSPPPPPAPAPAPKPAEKPKVAKSRIAEIAELMQALTYHEKMEMCAAINAAAGTDGKGSKMPEDHQLAAILYKFSVTALTSEGK